AAFAVDLIDGKLDAVTNRHAVFGDRTTQRLDGADLHRLLRQGRGDGDRGGDAGNKGVDCALHCPDLPGQASVRLEGRAGTELSLRGAEPVLPESARPRSGAAIRRS